MESDAVDKLRGNITDEGQALNSTILNYYKKFGRKRDLEQYFSLSTAQGEVRDPSSLFWRRMKSQNESSDSGERSRESSLEVCRISIKCSVPDLDPSSSQDENTKPKSDTESPPIIVEELPDTSRHSDNESVKSDDNNSQKSMDAILDTSINKAFSPTSSITSQRKLEWDSLADVGYNYESDKKTSASTLSTLERLALKQQYSNNDTKDDIGAPTAHSTPVDENNPKPKGKSKGSKTTKIYKKDVDYLQVNMPEGSGNPSQSINVNLTKHISFNVEKDGAVSIDNVKKDVSVTPEKVAIETEANQIKFDKEIQTSLVKTKDKSSSSNEALRNIPLYNQGIPVLINLNTLKKRQRRRKLKTVRRKLRSKKKTEDDKENLPVIEKSGEQVSDAESFEYMPGHMYNQNQMNNEASKSHTSGNKSSLTAGNKSSLESSAPTTDSSKGSRHSFTKDLEKSIKMLKAALHKRYDDSELKEKLIKEVVQRLIKANYRDDDTTTDFLSGLSFSSKKLGLDENTTTSTSDANNTAEKSLRPKKSILRADKFNSSAIASTSQSAPNLPSVSNSENPVSSKLEKALTSSNTESDVSSKGKTSSDTAFAKTSSEELYQKYLNALRREEAYRKHLRDKETFLRQKLVSSDSAFNIPPQIDPKSQRRIQELMKDLTRNNYDDGSGDASKLEGGLRSQGRTQRSHSVFTLSSSPNSEKNRRSNVKKSDMKDAAKPGHSKDDNHYCCCPHHYANKLGLTDSSVQVNINNEERKNDQKPCVCNKHTSRAGESPRSMRTISDNAGDIKCVCNKKTTTETQDSPDNARAYKTLLPHKGNQAYRDSCAIKIRDNAEEHMYKVSKCSQTNLHAHCSIHKHGKDTICIHEAIRCIQTDISINPKISDPVLTDIKIINKCDCCKLIHEQFRQVSKSSINTDAKTQDNADSDGGTVSSGESRRRRERQIATQTTDAEIQSDRDKPASPGNNFTIPIHGTNMTLKVNIGADVPKLPNAAAIGGTSVTKKDFRTDRPQQFEGGECVSTVFKRDEFSSLQTRPVNIEKPFNRANTHTGIISGIRITEEVPFRTENYDERQKRGYMFKDELALRTEKKYESNRYHEENGDNRGNTETHSRQTYIVNPGFETENVYVSDSVRPDHSVQEIEKQLKDTNLQSRPHENKREVYGVSADCRDSSTAQYYRKDDRSENSDTKTEERYRDLRGRSQYENRERPAYEDPKTGQYGPGPSRQQRGRFESKKTRLEKLTYQDDENSSQVESNEDQIEYQKRDMDRDQNCEPNYKNRKSMIRFEPEFSGPTTPNRRNSMLVMPKNSSLDMYMDHYADFGKKENVYNIDLDQLNTPFQNPNYREDKNDDKFAYIEREGYVETEASSSQYYEEQARSPKHQDFIYEKGPHSPRRRNSRTQEGNFILPSDRSDHRDDERRGQIPTDYGDQKTPRLPQHTNYDEQRKQSSPHHTDQRFPPLSRPADYGDQRRPTSPDLADYDNQRFPSSPGRGDYGDQGRSSDRTDQTRPRSPDRYEYDDQGRSRSPHRTEYEHQRPPTSPGRTYYGDQRNLKSPDHTEYENQGRSKSPIHTDVRARPTDRTDYIEQRQPMSPGRSNLGFGDPRKSNQADRANYFEQRRPNSPDRANVGLDPRNVRPADRTDSIEQRQPMSPGRSDIVGFDDPKRSKPVDRTDYIDQRRPHSPGRSNVGYDDRRNCRPNSPGRTEGAQRRTTSPSPSENKQDNKKISTSRNEFGKLKRPYSPEQQNSRQTERVASGKSVESPKPRPSRPRTANRSPRDPPIKGTKGFSSRQQSPTPSCDPSKRKVCPPGEPSRPRSPCPSEISEGRRPSSPYHQACVIDESKEPGIFQCRPKIMKCSCPPSYKCGGTCDDKHNPLPSEDQSQKPATTCMDPQCPSTERPEQSYERSQKAKTSNDLIMNVIQGITDKYSKNIKTVDKKKAYKEIISLMKYLLDTEDTDSELSKGNNSKVPESSTSSAESIHNAQKVISTSEHTQTQIITFGPSGLNADHGNLVLSSLTETQSQKQSLVTKQVKSVASGTDTVTKTEESSYNIEKKFKDQAVQLSDDPNLAKSNKVKHTESSDFAQTTDLPCTSSDSAPCKVLDKIRRECEKYHQKRCKVHHSSKKCECNQSSTSLSCDQCKRVHHCSCRTHKCKGHKTKGSCEKLKKKCIAYNLIIQTSDSMLSEEPKCDNIYRPMKNIIVKVPPRKTTNGPQFKEMPQKHTADPLRYEPRPQRSRSLPNENYPSSEEGFKTNVLTVRDYLEKNRPDFCEQYAKRQNCLKLINECRANERATQRELLRLQVQVDSPLNDLSAGDLRRLAAQLGLHRDQKTVPPKLISERDMKMHSERIFKTLPEQVQKKEAKRKECIKKTNLLMASLFKKNLQRKTLRGAVNLSNYSKVIKI